MAYNEELVHNLKSALELFPETFLEKKMFGGIAFLFKGKMTVGAINDDLMVRVISDKMKVVLNLEHVRPMDFTGKPMKEFIFVREKGYQTQEQLTQ